MDCKLVIFIICSDDGQKNETINNRSTNVRSVAGEQRKSRKWLRTSLGAGPKQIDDVEVWTQVAHDLELRHESLLLT